MSDETEYEFLLSIVHRERETDFRLTLLKQEGETEHDARRALIDRWHDNGYWVETLDFVGSRPL